MCETHERFKHHVKLETWKVEEVKGAEIKEQSH